MATRKCRDCCEGFSVVSFKRSSVTVFVCNHIIMYYTSMIYIRLISIKYYNLIGHSEVSKSLRHLLIYLDTCNWSLKLKLLWLD